MSGRTDLDLDAILAEFHSQEQAAPPVESAPAPRRRRAEKQAAEPSPLPEEGTMLYDVRPGRHAALEPQTPPKQKPVPAPSAPAPRQPVPPRPPRPAEGKRTEPASRPQAREQAAPVAAPRKKQKRKGGRLPLFAVLLVLAAVLAGILWWTLGQERLHASPEPEPIRMELGQGLEQVLEESSGSSRN